MGHVNVESLIDIQEVTVNVGQCLIIPFQSPQKHTLRFEEPPWDDSVRHALQHQPPARSIRPSVRRAEEYDAVGADVNGPVALMLLGPQIVRVEECSLQKNPTEGVTDPYDGVLTRALAFSKEREGSDQCLGVLVYEIVTGTAIRSAGVYIGVVAVDEDVDGHAAERRREEVSRPERTIRGGPRLGRRAVEAVDQNDVDFGVGMGVYCSGLVPGDVMVDDALWLGCCGRHGDVL